jgi:hypothetical protein
VLLIYSALTASAGDCIDMNLEAITSRGEQHLLCEVGGEVMQPCPRFERSLGAVSYRSVLASVRCWLGK